MKYELTDIKEDHKGTTVYRIRALEDINNDSATALQWKVKKGDLGGWVSGYHNLSQQGKCWIYDNSIVVDNARVEDDANVCLNSVMVGDSSIYNRSAISNSILRQNSMVLGNAKVCYSKMYDDSKIMKDSCVMGSGLYGDTQIRISRAKIDNSIIINGIVIGLTNISYSHIYRSIVKTGVNIKNSDISSCIISSGSRIKDSDLFNVKTNKDEYYTSTNIISMNDINNIKSMLFYQCNLFPEDDYVIAYKIVNTDFSSVYDNNFFYKVGEVIEEPNTDLDESKSCARGLHFSSPNYWIQNTDRTEKHLLLKAKIKLDDIVSIKNGKFRCKRAEILDCFKI